MRHMQSSKGRKRGKSKFVADFETTTSADDCRVWAWALCNVYDTDELYLGETIHDFCEIVSRLGADIYFHNLAFDGAFILDHLFRQGYTYQPNELEPKQFNTLISNMGKWFNVAVRWVNGVRTEFLDSLKKLPMSVSNVAKAFKLDECKLEIDYAEYRAPGHVMTDLEREYITADVVIVAKALREQFEQGMLRMTVGADSLAEFKDILGGKRSFESIFPILPDSMDADIRSAYRGGFTYCDPRFAKRVVGPGRTYDVNSLYPSVMYSKPVPYGEPIYFRATPHKNKSYPLWVMSITFTAKLKPNHIPCIQVKGHSIFSPTEYLTNIDEPITMSCTNVDLELWEDHYELDILSYNGGWQFKSVAGMFTDFIDKWMKIKSSSDGGLRTLAKLQLNSLYGKFATNPDVTGKYPVMRDGVVRLVTGPPETRNPVYTPVGVFITAYARDVTIRAAQQHYGAFAYADTDSLHLLVDDDPQTLDVDPSRLGAWKRESCWDKGLFVRAKCYTELVNGEHVTHVAGLPDTVAAQMTFESFTNGAVFSGKLLPERVPGGIVLKDVGYTLNI